MESQSLGPLAAADARTVGPLLDAGTTVGTLVGLHRLQVRNFLLDIYDQVLNAAFVKSVLK